MNSLPNPELHSTLAEADRVLSLLLPHDQYDSYQIALTSVQKELATSFQTATSLTTAHATVGFRDFLLSLRQPLYRGMTMTFATHPFPGTSDQLSSATQLLARLATIAASPEQYLSVSETGTSLDPDQATVFLGATRRVGTERDALVSSPSSRHVVIWNKGSAYAVDILDTAHRPKSLPAISGALESIISGTRQIPQISHPSVAVLSWNLSRDNWFEARAQLEADPSNIASFQQVDTALATLALEDFSAPPLDADKIEAIRTGAGSANRYADQVVGFVVYKDGFTGLTVDHAGVDGGIAVQLLNKLHEVAPSDSTQSASPPVPLVFNIPQTIPAPVPVSPRPAHVFSLGESVAIHALERVAASNLQPFLAHLALQSALRSVRDTIDAPLVVQPISMRHFAHGRSDPSYPITSESSALLDALAQPASAESPDTLALVSLFADALRAHKDLIKAAKQGLGVGPHIAVLRSTVTAAPASASALTVLSAWQRFANAGNLVYASGFDGAPGVRLALGNVYAPEHLVYWYLCSPRTVTVTMEGEGVFADATVLERLARGASAAFAALVQVATNYSLIDDMFADADLAVSRAAVLGRTVPLPEKPRYAVALHCGAAETFVVDRVLAGNVEATLRAALVAAEDALAQGGAALDVVQLVVRLLENSEMTNAGKGAVFNAEGTHELEASLVDGRTQRAGAVACARHTKNPILTARMVLEDGTHTLISGASVDELTKARGGAIVENSWFDSPFRRAAWEQAKMAELGLHPQTVGAVVLDVHGATASAASTGGVLNKQVGRIGDVAVPNAGLFASQKVAVACSGDGDVFLRHGTAGAIARAYGTGHSLRQAVKDGLDVLSKDNAAQGGVIAVNDLGQLVIHSTSRLFFAAARGPTQAAICGAIVSDGTPLPQNVFMKGKITAGLSHMPTTKGQAIVTWPGGETLFSLSADRFPRVLAEVQSLASVIGTHLNVGRVALVSDGGMTLQLVPLHGILAGDDWKPITHEAEQFDEAYPGYIHSRNGPKMSVEALDAVQSRITAHSGLPEKYSTAFDGPADDNSLFAKIVRGELEQWRVWEDEHHVAFLTPFPNAPGFTVLVPRKHIGSDIFGLEHADYLALVSAAHKVAQVLKKTFSTEHIGLMFEGYEVDYAHVKLVPRVETAAVPIMSNSPFFEKYPGFITSQPGVHMDAKTLAGDVTQMRSAIVARQLRSISAPKTWFDARTHHVEAISKEWYGHVFQIQNALFHETIKLFGVQLQYKYALVPVTSDCISSPMGLGSDSLPVQVELFGRPTYLADSMQFTLEYMLRFEEGLRGTYYVANSFRGEDPDSSHLNQFYHVECELLGGVDDAMGVAEQYVYGLTEAIRRDHSDSIRAIAGTTDHIDTVLALFRANDGKLPRITVDDAIAMMPADEEHWELAVEDRPECGRKLTRKGERFLIKHFGGACWLTEFDHLSCPFYQQYTDETKTKARCADMLIGLGETLGLGERHQTAEEVLAALNHHVVPPVSYQWYMDIRKVRPLKTSGWGMGTERYVAWLFQHDDIRDFALIPRLKGETFLP
ncbi:hypothetical protein B0H21DRAFT_820318 [Amylocystis lapponica]|nr:hypothetical protein B0H21DRAFT_820318 [Amylocystis lapponica]